MELTAHDPLAAHAELELRLDRNELTNPWLAAISSAVSFTIGALLPLIAITFSARVDAHRGHRRRGASRAGDHRLGGCSTRWR